MKYHEIFKVDSLNRINKVDKISFNVRDDDNLNCLGGVSGGPYHVTLKTLTQYLKKKKNNKIPKNPQVNRIMFEFFLFAKVI